MTIGATLAVILIGKPAAAFVIVWLFGYPLRVGLAVSVALAQIGEFSFIVAALGNQLGVLTPEVTDILIAAALFSISVNPLLFRAIGPVVRRLRRTAEGAPAGHRSEGAPTEHRVVVVGYGPVGQTVTRLLRENEIEPVVVELNIDTSGQLEFHT